MKRLLLPIFVLLCCSQAHAGAVLLDKCEVGSGGVGVATLACPVTVAANSTVILNFNNHTGLTITISDTFGLTTHLAVELLWNAGADTQSMYYAQTGANSGADTFTLTYTGGTCAFCAMFAGAYSGVITNANPVDVTSSATGHSTMLNSGSATTTQTDDLMIGGLNCNSCGLTAAYDPPLTAEGILAGHVNWGDGVTTAIGSYAASRTSNIGNEWVAIMATFKTYTPAAHRRSVIY